MDNIEYERCPYCYTKDISKINQDCRTVIKCNNVKECGNVIDSFPREVTDEN
jgi:hypothetical protein